MKLSSALLVTLGLPLAAAGCGLVLGIEERAVPANADAAVSPDGDVTGDAANDAVVTMDGAVADTSTDAPSDALGAGSLEISRRAPARSHPAIAIGGYEDHSRPLRQHRRCRKAARDNLAAYPTMAPKVD